MNSITDTVEHRTCRTCSETKPIKEFCRNKECHYGRSYKCQACHRQYLRARYASPETGYKVSIETWRKNNAEKVRERRRALAAQRRTVKPRRSRFNPNARTHQPEYTPWVSMRARCTRPSMTHYEYYGGRGIKVCERWMTSYDNFRADMGPRPSLSHTIDRINYDGDYEPSNCRWATKKEQASNRRPRSK